MKNSTPKSRVDERPHTKPKSSLPIKDHAIIGDMRTVALIDTEGTLDFMCLPRIDSPTLFATLLDPQGGSFRITFDERHRSYRQIYIPNTNILVTRVVSEHEVVEITDFMVPSQWCGESIIIRKITSIRGRVTVRINCNPAFGYATVKHVTKRRGNYVEFAPSQKSTVLQLRSDAPLTIKAGAALSEFTIKRGESRAFILGHPCDAFPKDATALSAYVNAEFTRTFNFWTDWANRSTYRGRYREIIMRSVLTLKLLVSAEHGSIAAAATFGLPEASAGARNWDYRFSWIRDASFVVYAFIRLGYMDEAIQFMEWVRKCFDQQCKNGPLQPMYRMDGSKNLKEQNLTHWAGYRDARPVRIGNSASNQLQLDIYGAVMDAMYLTSKYARALPLDAWVSITQMIDWLTNNWRKPDEGIWEARNGRHILLHSRLMCWVAVDRAMRLAQKRSLPAPMPQWNTVRSAIHHSIVNDFWNDEIKAFVRTPGTRILDASALMMPLVRFISARDPKWLSTQIQIEKKLSEDGLVFRYTPGNSIDSLPGHEGAFSTCSFWLVECLARQGETARAQLIFEKMIANGNHVGLFSEEIGPSGEHYGNFPQALTHLSLISATVALDKALNGKDNEPWH